jgi:UDP-N-acetylglucosamine 2-epimerase
MRVLNVVGARPNFMKIAPLMAAWKAHPSIEPLLVHTGQHYDPNMSDLFFEELGIPRPDINLEVRGGSHTFQHAEVMKAFEPVCLDLKPDLLVVVGDVNSTVSCALVAAKLGIRVAHVEAGLRSFERTMPEEINRVLTDQLADLLFVSEESGLINLSREGLDHEGVHFAGNVMIDSLLTHLPRAERSPVLEDLDLKAKSYGVLTLHRPANVDSPEVLERLLDVLAKVHAEVPLVFPAHPAHPRPHGEVRPARKAQSVQGVEDRRAHGLLRLPQAGAPRPHHHDRLGGHPGGDHRAAGALRDAARDHRAPQHLPGGHQPPRRHRSRAHLAGVRGGPWPPIRRASASPPAGTARPPSASPRSSLERGPRGAPRRSRPAASAPWPASAGRRSPQGRHENRLKVRRLPAPG